MSEAYSVTLMVAGFLVLTGIVIWLGAKTTARARENVRRLADRLGLQLEAAQPTLGIFYPEPRATGLIRGKAVTLYNYSTGSGKSRRTWSALTATPAAAGGLTFALSRQGLGTKLLELFGSKEITVGNAEFDGTWFVQTNAPEYFRAALLPELQEKFRPFRGAFKLEKGVVSYVEQGQFHDQERCLRFERAVGLVCDLADVAEVHARHGVR